MREVKLNHREHEKFIAVMEKRMNDQGMSIDDLADALGVKRQSIYNFRTDTSRNPSRFLAGKIATYFSMTPGEWRN